MHPSIQSAPVVVIILGLQIFTPVVPHDAGEKVSQWIMTRD
jgi:hypothetical protein